MSALSQLISPPPIPTRHQPRVIHSGFNRPEPAKPVPPLQARCDEALQVLRFAGEPVKLADIAERMNLSQSFVRRVMDMLRDQNKARVSYGKFGALMYEAVK